MKKKNVINFIALISMIGVLFGTMMMIIVLVLELIQMELFFLMAKIMMVMALQMK